MKIFLKWFLTGNVSELEERDELLGPNTTFLEVKGLIQLKYSYEAKHMLLIANKSLRENEDTLASIGITDQAAAEKPENQITVHVLSGADLEEEDEEEEGEEDAGKIHEFSHDDFIKASKMLGRDLPVSHERAEQVRQAPPRARPAFVDAKTAEGGDSAAAEKDEGGNTRSKIYNIYANVQYGLRKEGVEKTYGVTYPGVSEPFDFWDLRLSHEGHDVKSGQIAMEAFYFGDIEKVDKKKFHELVADALQRNGFRVEPVGKVREAGCMYPLIAVPIIMSETEASQLGEAVFERFGIPVMEAPMPTRSDAASGPAGGKEQCCIM